MQERTERIYRDYVGHRLRHLQETHRQTGQQSWEALQVNILGNLSRIKRRLGGLRYQQLCEIVPQAVSQLREHDDKSGFRRIIKLLIQQYYDPHNHRHMDRYRPRIVCKGNMSVIGQWLDQEPRPEYERRHAVKALAD